MKSEIQLYVSQKVREYRKQRGWSYRYLADCLNVRHSFVERCENPTEENAYNLNHINALARIFECRIWDLLPQYPIE